jgi:imidazolonepropionase-like amidohydrolase
MTTIAPNAPSMTGTALTDINTLRKRARQHIEEGAVTSGYGADREAVLKMLNADRIAERIVQLRGQPDFSPDGVAARSHAPRRYDPGGSDYRTDRHRELSRNGQLPR